MPAKQNLKSCRATIHITKVSEIHYRYILWTLITTPFKISIPSPKIIKNANRVKERTNINTYIH